MSDINLQLVREFFELNMFRVLTNWAQDQFRPHGGDHNVVLFVENTHPGAAQDLDVLLNPTDLGAITRAMVDVRAWHADRFYPSVIAASPVLAQFVEKENTAFARDVFNGQDFVSILVVSELPVSLELRRHSLKLLRDAGVDHVMEFPAILRDLVDKVSVNSFYDASPTLQVLRLLKRYRLFRNQQMEFAFRAGSQRAAGSPPVETAAEPEEDEPPD